MHRMKRTLALLLLGLGFTFYFSSCEEEMVTIGAEVIGGEPFVTDKAYFDVFVFNRKIEAVQTNKLPIYQLGVYQDAVYGRTEAQITSQLTLQNGQGSPVFGVYSQAVENDADSDENASTIDENERIKSVYLYLPFFQNPRGDRDGDGVIDELDVDPEDPNSDTDGDTISDNQERINMTNPLDTDTDGDGIADNDDDDTAVSRFPNRVDLDSIYGDRTQQFNLKVERSTFFLRDQDPNTNFEQAQEYYSSQQFAPGFVSDVLFEGDLTISDEEILTFPEDDPDTEEDESEGVPERLQPGVRVALDAVFFQQYLLDMEGKTELLSQANFEDFIRGIHMSLTPTAEDLLILFDLTRANITITYEYDRIEEGNPSVEEQEYTLSLITGGGQLPVNSNAVNTYINEAYPAGIAGAMDTGANASRIYLKGGAGSFAEVHLFETDSGRTIIEEIKANNWIINEANLTFHVDRTAMQGVLLDEEPFRLYLYNSETVQPIYNPINEQSVADTPFGIFLDYDGFLETDGGQGIKYIIRLTEHINNLVVRDSVNSVLGLTSTPDIRLAGALSTRLAVGMDEDLPVSSTISPLGTVLFGSDVTGDEEPMKLQLEISYTETN
ncbi:MAG: DUF4270 domain-containing protein [Flavobacteriaceae bacterium]|nr:DUF4270 domain-containing protein [Flavobacteriaceae bacterium]